MERLEVLTSLREQLNRAIVVASLGNTTRELYRVADAPSNLYLLGSMGMTVPTALGLSLAQPHRSVIALEGDGGMLMALGSLATAAAYGGSNLRIIIFDNGVYESTGGQQSHTGRGASLSKVARGCGLMHVTEVHEAADLPTLSAWLLGEGPRVAVVRCSTATQKLPRVPIEPPAIFRRFSTHISGMESSALGRSGG